MNTETSAAKRILYPNLRTEAIVITSRLRPAKKGAAEIRPIEPEVQSRPVVLLMWRQPIKQVSCEAFADLFFVSGDGAGAGCCVIVRVKFIAGTNDDVGEWSVFAKMFKDR